MQILEEDDFSNHLALMKYGKKKKNVFSPNIQL